MVLARRRLARLVLDRWCSGALVRMCSVAITGLDRRLGVLYAALDGRACFTHSAATTPPPAPPSTAAAPATLTAFATHLAAWRRGQGAGSFRALGLGATACALAAAFSAALLTPRGLAAALTALATLPLAPFAALAAFSAFATIPATLATIAPSSVAAIAVGAVGVTTMPPMFAPTVAASTVVAPRAAR